MAAKKPPMGFVIVQVERIAERGTLNPRQVEKSPESWSTAWWWPSLETPLAKTFGEPYSPAIPVAKSECLMQTVPPMGGNEPTQNRWSKTSGL